MEKLTEYDHLNDFAQLLLSNGYTIIVPPEPTTWMHFAKDGRIGYVQSDHHQSYDFSTEHKPVRGSGNGKGFGMPYTPHRTLLERAEDTLYGRNALGRPTFGTSIEQYASIEEFVAKDQKFYKNPIRVVTL